ncbi:TPA: terminase ATPase subunit family protein [Escherichia coli]|uniref:terminase ATPase subunit family protein n=3 Tax=Escherichia coli TaxID=562 RepID=UPI00103081EC|nr:terminase ATPase subunit family protein [Escherichia coli]EER0851799.1 terminase ATPase subunit family protein [Escherichia coli]EES7734832.1 terminase ATPase subunit family protein [Escherichia coli]EEY6096370.1 terminase ATPase subunit family protein [Escherichia coli]EFE0754704.1 terminase ATPase subunit family protein [Escherichia coli]EFG0710822.1 terminase ATPase subunit family protein [Escherichia coli]
MPPDIEKHLLALQDEDPRRKARYLYWQGFRIARIAELLGVKVTTLHSWKRRDGWDESAPLERVTAVTEARLIQLTVKENKEGKDFKEIDLLWRQMERGARVERYQQGGNEVDLNPALAKRNAGARRQPETNHISEEQAEKLKQLFLDGLYPHQKHWYRAGLEHRIRDINKSRQIGATMFFGREGFMDAVESGRNQIFLSASKAQAHQFRQYIVDFAREADVELKGDVIHLPHNDGRMYFLGTNARTAQTYHGNLYLDEYFWIHRFLELRRNAAGMASQKRWRQTYFSTPSSITHEAYKFWTGQLFNKGRPKSEQIRLDISHRALAAGRLCEDGQWRQIVTVEDAINQGYDLFDLEQLRLENSPEEFANLFMCQFIDDTASVFPLSMLQGCMVDSWEVWDDYKPFALRPLGERSVWVGYDPALSGDSAGCVVVAPPVIEGGKFRVIEKHQWHGMDFAAQAENIRKITERYNVTYIGIDVTGIGHGVHQLVKQFFPAVQAFSYSPEVKQRLVLKTLDVVRKRRLEFDAGWTDLAQAFMAIRKTLTPSGRQVTFEASRSEEVSHADLAWACMHAIINEPLESSGGANSGRGLIKVYG